MISEGQRSLREIVEAEGSDAYVPGRVDVVLLVQHIYRPAREMMRAGEMGIGKSWMGLFVEQSDALATKLSEEGDLLGSLLARHNAASGAGWCYGQEAQNSRNGRVLQNLDGLLQQGVVKPGDPDVVFIRSKVVFGLLENDTKFKTSYSCEQWLELIEQMEQHRYPDFPGRALAFVRALPEGRCTDEHIEMLRRAVVCDFGKDDQKADVSAYLASINNGE